MNSKLIDRPLDCFVGQFYVLFEYWRDHGQTPTKEAVDREHTEIVSLLIQERSRRAKAAEESSKWSLEKALNEIDREIKKKKDSDAE